MGPSCRSTNPTIQGEMNRYPATISRRRSVIGGRPTAARRLSGARGSDVADPVTIPPAVLRGAGGLVEDLLANAVDLLGHLVDRHLPQPQVVHDLVDRDLQLTEPVVRRL